MSLSSTGKAARNARASRQRWAKTRCEDVKVELDGSRRRIADLTRGTAKCGYANG